jgi:hypothetical protein
LAGLTVPPWLWVWLAGYLPASVLEVIGSVHILTLMYLDSRYVSGPGIFWIVVCYWLFQVLVDALLVAGVVTVVFPQLRGRWVERRFKLTSDDRPVMAEMQRFVDAHDPSVRLRFSIRADQMARIYPVGWRNARIAVFRPLAVLWHCDREAAQVVLLHEVAHRRQGDQLIVGLGSPFVWLVRIGALAYVLFVLVPAAVYLAAGEVYASSNASTGISLAALIPYVVFLPVTALWLVEFNADRRAVQEIGSGALQRALRAGGGRRAPLAARAIALLSHPPGRLRSAAAGSADTVALMIAWPAALLAFSLILPFAMYAPILPQLKMPHLPWGIYLQEWVHLLLVQGSPVVVATVIALLAWPALAAPWERLWSPGTHPSRHQPWWPYLAAASLPVGMLLFLSLAPIQADPQGNYEAGLARIAQVPCAQVLGMAVGFGTQVSTVETDMNQLSQAASQEDNEEIMAVARRLDSATQAALDNPSPGAAGASYVEAMTDFHTAAQEIMQGHLPGNLPAATNAIEAGLKPLAKAVALIAELQKRCFSSSLPAATPPG